MTPEESLELETKTPSSIAAEWLEPTPRTLLLGRDGYDNAFHVYLHEEAAQNELCIHILVWKYNLETQEKRLVKYMSGSIVDGRECIPFGSKWGGNYPRVFAERSDYQFCTHLIDRGVEVPLIFDRLWKKQGNSLFHNPIVQCREGRYVIVDPD